MFCEPFHYGKNGPQNPPYFSAAATATDVLPPPRSGEKNPSFIAKSRFCMKVSAAAYEGSAATLLDSTGS